ncbi:jg11299 [Pararge aegeria aegeria]|uniref:Jg11299 protein n=1 Tax=Pararge aegeria aegeria TaxID=348720 RepID=A0A8S4R8L4_9NEOP|nr:jg11299 [Pararge aegeria aegeria]
MGSLETNHLKGYNNVHRGDELGGLEKIPNARRNQGVTSTRVCLLRGLRPQLRSTFLSGLLASPKARAAQPGRRRKYRGTSTSEY